MKERKTYSEDEAADDDLTGERYTIMKGIHEEYKRCAAKSYMGGRRPRPRSAPVRARRLEREGPLA